MIKDELVSPTGPESDPPVLDITDLRVHFAGGNRTVKAVRGVSLSVARGERLGVVGESGSGKSVTFLGAYGLLPTAATVTGIVRLDGQDVLKMDRRKRRDLLGKDMAMVFQNPMSTLNPVMSIGAQIMEALRLHQQGLSRNGARERTHRLLEQVGVTPAEQRAGQYPHEFSGGMCQRAMIAMAIANKPKLLVADEPTTAVDVTIQKQLLRLLREVSHSDSGASVLISHDLGVIAENTERVLVLYGGQVMEEGPTQDVLDDPRHPYTQGLLSCHPSLDGSRQLVPIPGSPPDPATLGTGCPFVARCPIGRHDRRCAEITPPLIEHEGRLTACHHAGEVAFRAVSTDDLPRESRRGHRLEPAHEHGGGLLTSRQLVKRFGGRRFSRLAKKNQVVAVDGVDVALRPGETLGIVGESGSGKSTLAKVISRLEESSDGQIRFAGRDITNAPRRQLRGLRDRVQMVFQDPYNSLNPSLSVAANAAEPLRIRGVPASRRRSQVMDLFAEVGLGVELADRLPTELSGGQLQRVGIARALSVNPELVILDEPVSALDVSVQAQILNLLQSLQRTRGLGYLFISHDMAVVRYLAHRVTVMYLGRVVETGPADVVFEHPSHPYTEGLLAAVPHFIVAYRRTEVDLHGEQSSEDIALSGCRFHPRCPIAVPDCTHIDPHLEPAQMPEQFVACIVRRAGSGPLSADKPERSPKLDKQMHGASPVREEL